MNASTLKTTLLEHLQVMMAWLAGAIVCALNAQPGEWEVSSDPVAQSAVRVLWLVASAAFTGMLLASLADARAALKGAHPSRGGEST